MAIERLYRVTTPDQKPRLVRAANQAQVRSYLMRNAWEIDTPSPMDVAELVASEVSVESAGAQAEPQEESRDA